MPPARRALLFFCLLLPAEIAAAANGLKADDQSYEVDTGAGLVVKISRTNGDLASIKWDGTELNSQGKRSHIGSGLGSATVSSRIFPMDHTILITAETPTLTQYYAFREKEPIIYMATFITAEPPVGELRWITRLQRQNFDQLPIASCLNGNTGNVESKDVFRLPDGQTRSKYYGNQQAKDLTIRGITGPNRGIFMIYGNRETSSGGPFFRDIQNQSGEQTELYNYMNSGHLQTEPNRMGLHGPYALCLSHGETPAIPSMEFMQRLELRGWVKERGRITGTTSGTIPSVPVTIGWANAEAQYWAAGPDFTSPPMKPGIYDQTLYQGELAVAVKKVEVKAGQAFKADIAAPAPKTAPLWRIGIWDGTPCEFTNGETFPLRHPSDPLNARWPATFTVGVDPPSAFPAAQWAEVNTPLTIHFELTEAQVADHRLLIGITTAYALGRPFVQLNDWKGSPQTASHQPKSRGMTIGSYRGNNATFEFNIPASAFKPGANQLTISVTGRGGFSGHLSPGYTYDCLEMN